MAVLHHPRFVLAMRVLFWLALTVAVILAVLPHPPELLIDRFGDKFAHILAFGTLSGLAAFGFPPEVRWRVAERLSFVGALIEVVQSIPALHRDSDIRDWIADTLAIIVVMTIATLLQPRQARDTAPAA
jgi:VanZ family protein